METATLDRKVRIPEVRVNGNRFTVAGGGADVAPAAEVRDGAAGTAPADPAADEKTGIIPSHVWG